MRPAARGVLPAGFCAQAVSLNPIKNSGSQPWFDARLTWGTFKKHACLGHLREPDLISYQAPSPSHSSTNQPCAPLGESGCDGTSKLAAESFGWEGGQWEEESPWPARLQVFCFPSSASTLNNSDGFHAGMEKCHFGSGSRHG